METFRSSQVALADWSEEIHPAPWCGTRTAKPGDYKWIQQLASIVCSGEIARVGPEWDVAQTTSMPVAAQPRYDAIKLVQAGKSDNEFALVFCADLDRDSRCQGIGQFFLQPCNVP